MSTTIDNKVVSMRFDNKNFEQNVRKHLVYNTDMIPNLSNTHTLFVTNLLIA